MAIYQPTNIVPSSFAGNGNGTVFMDDQISVTWQINGTSPMSAYLIQFMQNDAASTKVYSTGVLYVIPAVYGTDQYGEVVPFAFGADGLTWQDRFFDEYGSYKLRITQFWKETLPVYTATSSLDVFGRTPRIDDGEYMFSSHYTIQAGETIVFSRAARSFYTLRESENGFVAFNILPTVEGEGETGLVFRNAPAMDFVQQYNESVFQIQEEPTLTISSSVEGAQGTFTATYEQAQGDSINWVRWQLSKEGSIIEDTGEINTGVLSYSFNRFTPGIYRIVCTVETYSNSFFSTSKRYSKIVDISSDERASAQFTIA